MRIKEILAERGMTMADLAERANMQQPAISRAMTGNPTVETLERLASALGVNIVELFSPSNDDVNGVVRVGSEYHEIKSLEDLRTLLDAKTKGPEVQVKDQKKEK